METIELPLSSSRGNNMNSDLNAANESIKPVLLFAEARKEISEIHLELQRFVVLAALRVCEMFGLGTLENLDRIPNSEVIYVLDKYRFLRKHWLVRAAFAVHNFLDRSRKLKTMAFRMVLWFKAARSVLYPQWRYAGYGRWLKKESVLRKTRAEQIRSKYASVQKPKTLVLLQGSSRQISKMRKAVEQAAHDIKVEVRTFTTSPIIQSDDLSFDLIVHINQAELSADGFWWILDAWKEKSWSVFFADSDERSLFGKLKAPRFHADYSLEYFISAHPSAPLKVINTKFLKAANVGKPINEILFSLVEQQSAQNNIVHHQQLVLSHLLNNSLDKTDEAFYAAASIYLKNQNLELQKNKWGYEVLPKDPASWPKVSIQIPTKDGLHLLKPLMEGLLKRTDYPNFDILIVNNNSSKPETFEYFKTLQAQNPGKVRVVDYPQPYNFSAINNFAMKLVDGELLALLNNDVEVLHTDWLKQMVRQAVRPDVGSVGAKLYFADGSIQHAGVVLGLGQVAGHVHGFDSKWSHGYLNRLQFAHEFSSLTCACFVLRRDVFVNSGYFSEDLAVAYNDVDFCLKIKSAGYRNIWTPRAELIHKESSTRPPDRRPEQLKRYRMEVDIMRERWLAIIENDPAYNRQLSRDKSDFRLNWAFDHL